MALQHERARDEHLAEPHLAMAQLTEQGPEVRGAGAVCPPQPAVLPDLALTPTAAVSMAPCRLPGARPTVKPSTELRPVSADVWSLRVTLDAAAKADLDQLASLLSHTKGRDLGAVLREAIRCGIEKHGKRKGAVAPERASPSEPPSVGAREAEPAPRGRRAAIPAAVRREVWKRDGGCCAWVAKDGRRCGSRWKLEFDHIRPVALGGTSTVDNVRVACKPHNLHHAEQVFGCEHMSLFLKSPAERA
jgi:hypothetical protein